MMATTNTKTPGARLISKDSMGYNNISQTYKPAVSLINYLIAVEVIACELQFMNFREKLTKFIRIYI
jgi:hypothetical protein